MDSQNACGCLFSSALLPTLAQKDQLNLLLRSNSSPPESSHGHSLFPAFSSIDLARYDTEIDRVQQMLARLTSERAELQEYSKGYSSAFAPVRRLPTEIVVEIFASSAPDPLPVLFCDPSQEIPSGTNSRVAQRHLINLSQVCLGWHGIVMGTPSLWANIEVDLTLDPSARGDFDRAITGVSRSLDLSGFYPLTIQVNTYADDAIPGLKLLAQHCERWRVVDMYAWLDVSACISRVKGNLPRLERLGLGGFQLAEVGIFETAPKLTHVILSDFDNAPPGLPWSQLLEITYYSSRPEPIAEGVIGHRLAILARCSNQCEFNIYTLNLTGLNLPIFDLVPVRSDIRILRLAILDLGDEEHCRQAVGEIVGTLTLPCLQELHLWSTRMDQRLFWPRDHFSAFASRSSFAQTLIKLSLHDMVITEDELVACLSEMCLLSELFIQDVARDFDHPHHILLSTTLLQRLVWRPDDSCLIPNLTTFTFASLFDFDDDTFLHMVTSRLVAGSSSDGPFKIQTTRLMGQDLRTAATARLSEFERRGLLRWSRRTENDLRAPVTDVRCVFNLHFFPKHPTDSPFNSVKYSERRG
ncbi:hypothetical protein DFH06DRAFT_1442113 [Mycena polygramma]|nr:hypothetical protein DFH06DRAFT_1442113 [Mycena polygramma]